MREGLEALAIIAHVTAWDWLLIKQRNAFDNLGRLLILRVTPSDQ